MKTTLQKTTLAIVALTVSFAFSARAGGHSNVITSARGSLPPAGQQAPSQAPPDSLWYNGDFDGVNGLANEENTLVSDARTYDDFVVTDPNGWDITAVFSDNLADTGITGANYEIRSGVSNGNGGTLLYSGTTATPEVTATGRSGFGYTEYMVTVTGLNIHLDPGTYWLNVTPIGNGNGRSFVSTTSGADAVGEPQGNDGMAYFDSTYFGFHFLISTDPQLANGHDFSMGVIGMTSGGGGELTLTKAVSRKTHGGAGPFDVTLPGIDPREGIGSIVFTFSNTLSSVDSVDATCGTILGTQTDGKNYSVRIDLSSCDEQNVTVTLHGVHDNNANTLDTATATVGVLVGDVDGDGTVTAADAQAIHGHLREPVTQSNFRNDVIPNGTINAMDVRTTKSKKGDSL